MLARSLRSLPVLTFAASLFFAAPLVVAEEASGVDFDRQIRPILSRNCFQCHGPDEHARQAGLRLDLKSGALAGGDSGEATIVPGDPAASELVLRINATDDDVVMPPPDANNQPTAEEKALIARWIGEGAAWEPHWAFVAPRRPALPDVKRTDWTRDELDRFVLARLERERTAPSAEADRRTLLRRVTFDLTGLPPTPQEVADFLADESPQAYEKVVDRLLATTRYAERMTLEWLDAARYADTHGYHEDYHRDMWPWRDWVIQAFNENMPFDQFATEQIAGDLIPNRTNRQLVATGFCRNHGITASGISEEYRVEYALDRARTTATVFLGLTMGCAQCHDHKYDPISQRDFYRFFAYFNTVSDRGVENGEGNMRPRAPVVPQRMQSKLDQDRQRAAELKAQLAAKRDEAAARMASWEAGLGDRKNWQPNVSDGLAVHVDFDTLSDGQVAVKGSDAASANVAHIAVEGAAATFEGQDGAAFKFDGTTRITSDLARLNRAASFSLAAWVRPEGDAVILGRTNEAESYRGYDLVIDGGRLSLRLASAWTINAVGVLAKDKLPLGEWSHIVATYDGSGLARGVKLYVNGERQEVEARYDRLKGDFEVDMPLEIGHRHGKFGFRGGMDDLRIYRRAISATEVQQLAGRDPIGPLLAIAPDERTEKQSAALREYYLAHVDPNYGSIQAEHRRLEQSVREEIARLPSVMVMDEMKDPRDTFVLVRGQYDQHGERVEVGTPDVLPPLAEDAPQNRLGLARWLVDPSHPLTSRVTVNRLWQIAFGTGLVKTSEDFGIQGERPSHPELLDYLSIEFVESGWDVKAMMKRLVMSATYRQSSVASREQMRSDPENRLLGRGPRYRLPAEMIRDNALFVSGLLVEKIGGPSVKPYQPPGLWVEISNRGYVQDKGEKLYRRSMYTYWKRAVPPPNLAALDAPNRETCTVRRQRTNTPLMALVLLNDPTFVEASRALAERVMLEGDASTEARIAGLYRRVLAREPLEVEGQILGRIFARQLDVYQNDESAAKELLSVGESPRNGELDLAEHAAWTCVASTVLNLDEAVSKE
ncbi:MAG: DUF1553 domain-containing protein [Planctomycetota bacterium]|nr:MAG: DUF1553 domain-containing protein [Planctomycetota bacterium]REK24905.1 MAG: DUF1553 domain-containing protein [Planctomycetota bacterium]REK48494.1 MAG: DUF1553 domain-containing protein [Planctomycetota bacterium]